MTREEAIEILEGLTVPIHAGLPVPIRAEPAFDMAIEALKAQSDNNDIISRREAIAEFSCCELTPDGGIDANYAIDFLEHLPSAQADMSEYSSKLWHNAYERGKRDAQSEIVRCKDCVHSDMFQEGVDNDMPLKCLSIRYGGVMPDWYCEHAERRTE